MKSEDFTYENGKAKNDNIQTKDLIDMDSLLERLKKEDAHNNRIMRNFKWVYIVFTIIYLAFFVLNPELKLYERISGGCYILSFIFLAFLLNYYSKMYKKIDYSESVFVVLTNAVNRYKFKFSRIILAIFALIPIDLGMMISNYYRNQSFLTINILYSQIIFVSAILIGFTIGILKWKRRQKPLRDKALLILKELHEQ